MRDTKSIGEISEAKLLACLLEKGWLISIPFGERGKYDLIADTGEELLRIQVKTGRLRNGVVLFNTRTSHYHRGGADENYKGKADLFGVYCPDLDSTYLVPVDRAGTGACSLRVEAAKTKANNQYGMRYAKEYEV